MHKTSMSAHFYLVSTATVKLLHHFGFLCALFYVMLYAFFIPLMQDTCFVSVDTNHQKAAQPLVNDIKYCITYIMVLSYACIIQFYIHTVNDLMMLKIYDLVPKGVQMWGSDF